MCVRARAQGKEIYQGSKVHSAIIRAQQRFPAVFEAASHIIQHFKDDFPVAVDDNDADETDPEYVDTPAKAAKIALSVKWRLHLEQLYISNGGVFSGLLTGACLLWPLGPCCCHCLS